jgi:hypothetical protein
MTMSDDYEVGFGRPPKRHQFKKGQSGNPNGRRSVANFDKLEIIERVFSEKVTITIEGKRKKVSKFEAGARMTVHIAMQKGDIRAFERMMELLKEQGADWRERWAEEARLGAERTMEKIATTVNRLLPDVDPAKVADRNKRVHEELGVVLSCPDCGPFLKERWTTEASDKDRWASIRRAHATNNGESRMVPLLEGPSIVAMGE